MLLVLTHTKHIAEFHGAAQRFIGMLAPHWKLQEQKGSPISGKVCVYHAHVSDYTKELSVTLTRQ